MDTAQGSTMSNRRDLVELLKRLNLGLPESWGDDTSLIRSGILDSVGLLDLLLWIESRLGRPVDPTEFDIAGQWDTVRDILRFVDTQRTGGALESGSAS